MGAENIKYLQQKGTKVTVKLLKWLRYIGKVWEQEKVFERKDKDRGIKDKVEMGRKRTFILK